MIDFQSLMSGDFQMDSTEEAGVEISIPPNSICTFAVKGYNEKSFTSRWEGKNGNPPGGAWIVDMTLISVDEVAAGFDETEDELNEAFRSKPFPIKFGYLAFDSMDAPVPQIGKNKNLEWWNFARKALGLSDGEEIPTTLFSEMLGREVKGRLVLKLNEFEGRTYKNYSLRDVEAV